MVTGASTGIGRAIAKQLASVGTDLVLVARDRDRLDELAGQLSGIDVEVLAADLTDGAQRAGVEARAAATDRPVDLLVNNAGMGSDGDFCDLELDTHLRMIDLNVVALVRLCHAAGPRMRASQNGTILNISSVAGSAPGGGLAIYAATKAFVTSFSESLHQELEGHGVKVSAVCPGLTRTEFHDRSGYQPRELPNLAWQSAEAVASEALSAAARNQAIATTGWPNRMASAALRVAPRGLVRTIATKFRD